MPGDSKDLFVPGLTGAFVRDDSGHWYLVPTELVEEFQGLDAQGADGNAEACSKFDRKFNPYRCDLHPSHYVVTLVGEREP